MISVSSCFFYLLIVMLEKRLYALALHLHFFLFPVGWGTRKFEDWGIKEFMDWRGGLPGFLEGEGIFVGVGSVPHYMS